MNAAFGTHTFARIWTSAVLLCISAVVANAKVDTPDWKSLFLSAKEIAIIKVDSIRSINGVRIAFATVVEPVAGLSKGKKVAYVAEQSWFWTCDESNADVGETALLLLEPIGQRHERDTKSLKLAFAKEIRGGTPLFAIAWAGWGRVQAQLRGNDWSIIEPVCGPPRYRPAFRDPPIEFKRQRRGHSIPLAAVRAFDARLRSRLTTAAAATQQ